MTTNAKTLAKKLRANMTLPEILVWNGLKHRTQDHPIFRLQYPIGPYVVDFYCAKARLVIEIDGLAHATGNQGQKDERRDAWLSAKGLLIVRYDAKSVLDDTDDIIVGIIRLALDRTRLNPLLLS
jgi:very-short-patch-repair endonuclease